SSTDPETQKPKVVVPKDGGTGETEHFWSPLTFLCGSFGDSDLEDIGNDGSYKPDPGRGGGYSSNNSSDMKLEHLVYRLSAGSGQIAGIVSAVGVALLGAASSYFAYQKKKLCFKIQGGRFYRAVGLLVTCLASVAFCFAVLLDNDRYS
uniref:Uncharacterized protein n=1 Tax=Scleropages formosus TaxID=113540 RepID=A0A8C9VDM1_SCLFO